jgi:ribosomal protein S18 acetylase RimI-like enzyme
MEPDHTLLMRIARSVAANASLSRSVTAVGPFLAVIDRDSTVFWSSFAAPNPDTDDEAEWSSGIVRIREHFKGAGRGLRFEFINDLFPGLRSVMQKAGLRQESRQPLSFCLPGQCQPESASGAHILTLDLNTPEHILAAYIGVRREAFAETDAPDIGEEIKTLRRAVERGAQRCRLALVNEEPAGVGCALPSGGCCEVAGIGTVPRFRGRGVASAVVTNLVQDHFSSGGDLAWLTAADSDAERLYIRLGFQRAGAFQVNFEDGCG